VYGINFYSGDRKKTFLRVWGAIQNPPKMLNIGFSCGYKRNFQEDGAVRNHITSFSSLGKLMDPTVCDQVN
jgi:hypothetical protein